MIEGLFVITTIFVSYVVYQIVNEPKTTNISEEAHAVTETPAAPEQAAAVVEPSAPEAVVAEAPAAVAAEEVPAAVETPAAETVEAAAVEVEAEAAPSTEHSTPKAAGIKNPKTGEVVIVYNNYRFAKRWIKEALVAEGLLKKIYKNNELNADVEAKIKAALATLESMDKYHV